VAVRLGPERSADTGLPDGRMERLEVVVTVRWGEMECGRSVERWSRRSVVDAAEERENETVGGSERPGKVLRRMLTLGGNSMVASMVLFVSFDRSRKYY
jgi:hypothetical protein